jgi:hypothetical protein
MLRALKPWQRATSHQHPVLPGAAALSAEKRKPKKYEGVVNLFKFVPFAVKTLCPFGEEALDLFKDLGRRLIVLRSSG